MFAVGEATIFNPIVKSMDCKLIVAQHVYAHDPHYMKQLSTVQKYIMPSHFEATCARRVIAPKTKVWIYMNLRLLWFRVRLMLESDQMYMHEYDQLELRTKHG